MTGRANTGLGAFSLSANTTGQNNVASGVSALAANTTGNNNTASGVQALFSNRYGQLKYCVRSILALFKYDRQLQYRDG